MSELEQPSTDYKSDAPFNSAIDCLMRISRLIQKIEKVSVEYILYTDIPGLRLSAGQAQHIKARLTRELYKQARPLMNKAPKESLLTRLKNIQLKVKKSFDRSGQKYVITEVFDKDIDWELDNIVMEIEDDLQENNFFMPPKRRAGQAVLRR